MTGSLGDEEKATKLELISKTLPDVGTVSAIIAKYLDQYQFQIGHLFDEMISIQRVLLKKGILTEDELDEAFSEYKKELEAEIAKAKKEVEEQRRVATEIAKEAEPQKDVAEKETA